MLGRIQEQEKVRKCLLSLITRGAQRWTVWIDSALDPRACPFLLSDVELVAWTSLDASLTTVSEDTQ